MKKLLYTATFAVLLGICPEVNATQQNIGSDGSNPTATSHLHEQLSKTATVTAYINDKEYALTEAETAQLLQLLQGAQAAAPRCAPDDCFYLNLPRRMALGSCPCRCSIHRRALRCFSSSCKATMQQGHSKTGGVV